MLRECFEYWTWRLHSPKSGATAARAAAPVSSTRNKRRTMLARLAEGQSLREIARGSASARRWSTAR